MIISEKNKSLQSFSERSKSLAKNKIKDKTKEYSEYSD
jgi:hypothetical protein